MAGHRRAEATPSFDGVPGHDGMRDAVRLMNVAGVTLVADLSGALFWEDERLLVVSDLHLEKGSRFPTRDVLLPPYDTMATLSRLSAVIARTIPAWLSRSATVFMTALLINGSRPDRDAIAVLQVRRDLIWISGNHDPSLPSDLGRIVASEAAIGGIAFRHEPNGASGEITGHLHPKARVATRGVRWSGAVLLRRRARRDAGIRRLYRRPQHSRRGVHEDFPDPGFTAHVLGDNRLHAIAASRCY